MVAGSNPAGITSFHNLSNCRAFAESKADKREDRHPANMNRLAEMPDCGLIAEPGELLTSDFLQASHRGTGQSNMAESENSLNVRRTIAVSSQADIWQQFSLRRRKNGHTADNVAIPPLPGFRSSGQLTAARARSVSGVCFAIVSDIRPKSVSCLFRRFAVISPKPVSPDPSSEI